MKNSDPTVRLNVFLSRCGVASRRGADELITSGRVTLNGHPATVGCRVDPTGDEVRLDGRPLIPVATKATLVLNKPAGYLVSRRDPHYTKTVYDLLPSEFVRFVPVGRLDLNTEGVLLMTDDGDLVQHLTHPKYGVSRIYRAVVKGHPSEAALDLLRMGVMIESGLTGRAEVRICSKRPETTELEILLREGRKREVRLMCRAVGHEVLNLRRTEFAGITAANLAPGFWRLLTPAETASLWKRTDPANDRGN